MVLSRKFTDLPIVITSEGRSFNENPKRIHDVSGFLKETESRLHKREAFAAKFVG